MIELKLALSTCGYLLVILGGIFGAIGFFREDNSDIYNRTKLYFYNEEHFKTMLNQKYSEIFGFILIGIGSGIQFLLLIINIDDLFLYVELRYYLIILIITSFFIYFLIRKLIDKKIDKTIKLIRIPEEINAYNNNKEKNNKVAVKSLKNIADLLGKPFDVEEKEAILEDAMKFCEEKK